ncbi:MAG: hypothetical protein LBN08_06620 [Lactobacillales bacterium]|jgi:hypothetical protein|nr:hypothetical protein [Lactobacillales bacterium]
MKIFDWLRREFQIGNSLVRPEQGVITIMAIIIIVPSILFAILMIETTRLLAVKNESDVAMQAAGNSALTNYDQYTYERFGVMSHDQSQNMQQQTEKDIAASQGLFSGDVSDILVEGRNPLSDIGALTANITGYSEYNGLGAVFNKFVKLDKFLGMFNDMLKMENLDFVIAGVKGEGEALKALKTVAENTERLADSVQEKINTYDGLYDAWANAVDSAVVGLKAAQTKAETARAQDSHDDEAIDSTYDSEVKAAKATLETPYNNYYNWHYEMETTFKNYRNGMVSLNQAIDSFNNVSRDVATGEEVNAAQQRVDNDDSAIKATQEKLKDTSLTAEERSGYEAALGEYQTDLIDAHSALEAALAAEQQKAAGTPDAFIADFDSISNEITKEKTELAHFSNAAVDVSTPRPDPALYHHLDFSKFLNKSQIDAILDQYRGGLSGSAKGMFDALKNMFAKFGELSVFADPHLNAKINTDYYDGIKGLVGNKGLADGEINMDPMTELVGSLIQMITTPVQLMADLATLNIFKLIEDIIKFFEAVVQFFEGIGTLIYNIIERIRDIVTGRLDTYLVLPYLAFNFPNRLNGRQTLQNGVFDSYKHTGENLSGISYSKMRYTPPENSLSTLLDVGGLSGILEGTVGACPSGDDYAFTSCELEYILTGKTNELTAQEYTFISILIFRLLPNIPAVSGDKIIGPLTEIPIVGQIIFVLALIAESFVDTFLIVNGAQIKVIGKDKCFIATDFFNFIDKIAKIEGANKIIADSIRDNFKDGAPKNDPMHGDRSSVAKEYLYNSWFELDYTQHIFLLMFVGNNTEYIKRVMDLIEMEGTLNSAYEYYGSLGDRVDIRAKVQTLRNLPGSHYYDIKKAYTRVRISSHFGLTHKLFDFGASSGGLNKLMRNQINVGY